MTPEVEAAIQEIRNAFPDHTIDVEVEPQGGAYVIVHDLALGSGYEPASTWCGFLLTFQYPYADVYPHFIDGAVRRVDGQAHGVAFSGPTTWQNRTALQVSRRSAAPNADADMAALKLGKVIAWIRAQ